MNTKKGNICTIIAVFVLVMMLSCISSIFGTGCAVYAQDDGVYRKLVSLQEKFPDGKYWNHIVPESEAWKNCTDESYADSCTDVPCAVHGANVGAGSYDCNFFDGGWQCCGFAKKIFFDIFGERESSDALRRIYGSAGLSVGDYVHFSGFEHYAVVLSISDSTFNVAECNLDGFGSQYNCIISWGREYQLSQIDYYVHSNNYDAVNITCDHLYKITRTKTATLTKNGLITKKCSKCGEVVKETIHRPGTIEVSKSRVSYTGKALKPGITVLDTQGNSISGKYYSVRYANNKSIGNATATVKFKGRYRGSKKLTFSIVPKGTSITSLASGAGSFTVSWSKQTRNTTGYNVEYSEDESFETVKESITFTSNKITEKYIGNVQGDATYYVRVRTYKKSGSKKFYSDWSNVGSVKTDALKRYPRAYKVTSAIGNYGEDTDIFTYNKYGLIEQIKSKNDFWDDEWGTTKFKYTYYPDGTIKSYVRNDRWWYNKILFNKYGAITDVYFESSDDTIHYKGTPTYYEGTHDMKQLVLKGKIGKYNLKMTYEYDRSGRMIQSNSYDDKIVNTYDELGQLTSSVSYYEDSYYSLRYEYHYQNGVLQSRTEYEATETEPEESWGGEIKIDEWNDVCVNYKTLRCARYMTPFLSFDLPVYNWE